eukprot:1551568-Amphidinium_carterae.2
MVQSLEIMTLRRLILQHDSVLEQNIKQATLNGRVGQEQPHSLRVGTWGFNVRDNTVCTRASVKP